MEKMFVLFVIKIKIYYKGYINIISVIFKKEFPYKNRLINSVNFSKYYNTNGLPIRDYFLSKNISTNLKSIW